MSPYLAFFIGLTTAFVIDAVFCIINKKRKE